MEKKNTIITFGTERCENIKTLYINIKLLLLLLLLVVVVVVVIIVIIIIG